ASPTTAKLNATDTDANLTGESAKEAAPARYQLAVQKLQSGAQMTSDDYRDLGVGCVGYETDRTYFQDVAKVSLVYRDSPAEKAGIKKGDRILDHEDDSSHRETPDEPSWCITLGKAGTTAELTLLRHNRKIPITLVRMNVEDIKEDDIRQMWEKYIRDLGNPTTGTFTIPQPDREK
ncbi:MAG TPA: PDZ domain-containing protein, partial [Chroococcales cyanobacterium]